MSSNIHPVFGTSRRCDFLFYSHPWLTVEHFFTDSSRTISSSICFWWSRVSMSLNQVEQQSRKLAAVRIVLTNQVISPDALKHIKTRIAKVMRWYEFCIIFSKVIGDISSGGFHRMLRQSMSCWFRCAWGYPWQPEIFINGHATGTDLLEVHSIYKAYFSGLFFRVPTIHMAFYGTKLVPPF